MRKTTKLTLFILISFLLPMAALFLQSRITNDNVNLLLFGVQAASPSIAAFAVLLLSKEVRPHFKAIYQNGHITAVIVIPVLIASITMLISKSVYCIVFEKAFSLGNISVTKWLILLWALVAEELGWRGYLEPFLREMKIKKCAICNDLSFFMESDVKSVHDQSFRQRRQYHSVHFGNHIGKSGNNHIWIIPAE